LGVLGGEGLEVEGLEIRGGEFVTLWHGSDWVVPGVGCLPLGDSHRVPGEVARLESYCGECKLDRLIHSWVGVELVLPAEFRLVGLPPETLPFFAHVSHLGLQKKQARSELPLVWLSTAQTLGKIW
jgi:hypothetical protein